MYQVSVTVTDKKTGDVVFQSSSLRGVEDVEKALTAAKVGVGRVAMAGVDMFTAPNAAPVTAATVVGGQPKPDAPAKVVDPDPLS